MTFVRSFAQQVAAVLFAVLLSLVVPGATLHAQTILNVAEANWQHHGVIQSERSNAVEITVRPLTAQIRTYVAGLGTQLSYVAPVCSAVRQTSAVPPPGGLLQASATPSQVVRAGRDLYFSVSLPSANRDPSAIDRVSVSLSTTSGDREDLTIFETGPQSGEFVGRMATRQLAGSFTIGDCVLDLVEGQRLMIAVLDTNSDHIVLSSQVDVLADPFGVVFDSETGEAISGATVTLVDAATGLPAAVYAEDGVTAWPSTVISGNPVTDGAGRTVQLAAGEYWFPLARLGTYRLVITPPAPYTAPSQANPERLAQLTRPSGASFAIVPASFGQPLTLVDAQPVNIDLPVDRPAAAVAITKAVSRETAEPGDALFYTLTVRNPDAGRARRDVVVTDSPSPWLRLRRDSVRIDGAARPDAVSVSADGRRITFNLGTLPGGARRRITYAMTVQPDAPAGQAENRADATDSVGRVDSASAAVRIEREVITRRMTIIGRVTAGDCSVRDGRIGIPGVRVMLEDGSFAITDADGRYHFEGVIPGTHVVQAARSTLPEGGRLVDCTRSTRSAGSANSRFVAGRGGSLVVADFHARVPAAALLAMRDAAQSVVVRQGPVYLTTETQERTNTVAEWLASEGPDDWLAPTLDANPRTTAVRVAIRHRRGHTVTLMADGVPVNALLFEGTSNAPRGGFSVSQWRGVPLSGASTRLIAEIRNGDGELITTLEREVHFTTTPARVELLTDRSRLVADGRSSPQIAIRVLDAAGRPMREGVSGEFTLSAPYQSAEQLTQQQLNQLTLQGPATARWTVSGSEGVALIDLAPTMVSGRAALTFRFDDGQIVREQHLDAWIVPGDVEWTIIGLAEGTVGAQSVADNMERTEDFTSDLGEDARVALYAKGRVLGRFLVTLAYDSARQEDDQRLLGTLDPDAYYTVFADGSSRQFDAASRGNLYVRVEASTFYALYGDFETGFDQTRLTAYHRVATGLRAEAQLGQVQLIGFGAEIGTSRRRDEMQGQGISGPYRLSSSALVPNSERVVLEVRDRFRPDVIIDRRELARFADYDIDRLSGTITFRQPVISRDFEQNPRFIVIDYETQGATSGEPNVGLRAQWQAVDGAIRIGATAVTDHSEGHRTAMGGMDLRARIDPSTEVRAELAASRRNGDIALGWVVEAQHQSGDADVMLYARQLDDAYGVGQQNGVDLGRRKVGLDGRVRLTEHLSVLASLWQDDNVTDSSRRRAAQLELARTGRDMDLRVGLASFEDRLANGDTRRSSALEAGATQRLLDNRVEVSASTSVALDQAESTDLPERHRLGARINVTDDVRLVGVYEIARGQDLDTRSLRAGFEITPWSGGLVRTDLGQQSIRELGSRNYAAFGLAQMMQLGSGITLDLTFDSNWTLGTTPGLDELVNPQHPAPSGGQLSGDYLFEEFTAITAGASWQRDRWNLTGRGEWRDGEFANRHGAMLGAVRQIGEGSMVGSGLTWTHAAASNGATSEIINAVLAAAHRPVDSELAMLAKLEFRSDAVTGAVAGEVGPDGRSALLVDGNATSHRMMGSVNLNWAPSTTAMTDDDSDIMASRSEVGMFLGVRHALDSFEGYDVAGTTLIAGLDLRLRISEHFDLGAIATVRSNLADNVTSYAVGPQIGISPVDNVLLTIGYNFNGFDDPDYGTQRNTSRGVFAAVRMKFDADAFGFLGLGR